jgi:uncharacterized membrane protein
MNSNAFRISKESARSALWIVLGLEVLLFLLPDSGKVEGIAFGYWNGVGLRLSSGKYWAIALISGIGSALLLAVLLIFSNYLGRFVKPPSNKERDAQ